LLGFVKFAGFETQLTLSHCLPCSFDSLETDHFVDINIELDWLCSTWKNCLGDLDELCSFSMKYMPSGIKGTGKELQHFCYTNLSLRLLQFAVTASIVADLRGMSCCNLSLFGFFSIAQHCAVQVPGTPPSFLWSKKFQF
jgi:hypothetical protein